MKVTFGKHYLPKFEEFTKVINQAWAKNQITNSGSLDSALLSGLSEKFSLNKTYTAVNGTVAIAIALINLKKLNLAAKYVITSPFTHISTVWGIRLAGLNEIFCDIEEKYCSLDPNKVLSQINDLGKENVLCILPVHPLSSTSDVIRFEEISDKLKIPIVYDASHSVGVNFDGKSLLNFGDISIASTHATKVFSTAEGGIIVVNSSNCIDEINEIKYFGLNLNGDLMNFGLNGKFSELNAAFGICSLSDFNFNLERRKNVFDYYIKNLKFDSYKYLQPRNNTASNFSYFPIIFESESSLISLCNTLAKWQIGYRRYFYPSLDYLIYKRMIFPNANSVASRILCLPMNYDQSLEQSEYIVSIVNSAKN